MPINLPFKMTLAAGLLACSASLPAFAASTSDTDTGSEASHLSKEDLYNILSAEFAIRRGNPGKALEYYLEQAKIHNKSYLAERATLLAMQQNQYIDMLQAALIWEKTDPANEQPHFYTSLAYSFNMQPNIALEHMRKVLRLNGETDFTRLANMIPSGSPSEDFYIHELQQAIAEHPESYDIPLALALLYQRHNQSQLALKYTDITVRNAGDNVAAMEFAARLYSKLGLNEQAISLYQEAVSKSPYDLELRQGFAQFAVQVDLDLAREQFEYLLNLAPHDDFSLINLGLIALEQNDLQKAEQCFLMLKNDGNRLSSANLYLGEAYRLQQKYDQALSAYAQVTDKQQKTQAQEKSIAIFIEQGRHDKAEHLIDAALKDTSDPDHVERIQLLSAFNLEKQGKNIEAYQLLTQLLDKNPDSFELRYSRAMLAEAKNEIDKMESDLRHIITLDPKNAVALNALGYTLADKTTRYREALDLIEQARRLVPDDPAILDSLGWVLYRMGRFSESVGYLKHSLSMLPDAEVAAHLAEALWMSGMKDDAREVLKKALDNNPGHPLLNETIKRLNLSF